MTKEEIQQRIRYLVEFGGVYEDPVDEVRRTVQRNRVLAGVALVLVIIDVAFELSRL